MTFTAPHSNRAEAVPSRQKLTLRAFVFRRVLTWVFLLGAIALVGGELLAAKFTESERQSRFQATISSLSASIKGDLEFGDLWAVRRILSSALEAKILGRVRIIDVETGATVLQLPYEPSDLQIPHDNEIWVKTVLGASSKGTSWFFEAAQSPIDVLDSTWERRGVLLSATLLMIGVFAVGTLVITSRISSDLRLIDSNVAHLSQTISDPSELLAGNGHTLETERTLAGIRRTQVQLAEVAAQQREYVAQKAIAQTTQMLAHDVRKPFSMLRMGLDLLAEAKNFEEVKEVTEGIIPEVEQAIMSVTGLIQDVMEIGGNSKPLVEPTSPESIIEAVLNEAFRIYTESNIEILYDFRHNYKVNIDTVKVHRVFANIIGNGIQAMSQKGTLWIKTREVNEGPKRFVEFCLGNSGSFISAENLPRLFDAFYTSGKKGGTGLGLAIAQKIVVAHGGRIWCTSQKDDSGLKSNVEFWFLLPIAESSLCKSDVKLPRHSSETLLAIKALKESTRKQVETVDPNEQQFEREIIGHVKKVRHPLKIHFVDDEPVYRNALKSQIEKSAELAGNIQILKSGNAEEALKTEQDFGPSDFYIFDIDLGQGKMNGFDLVRELRKRNSSGSICIHSNRSLPADYRLAMEVGAQAFLPKPMTRAHLLKFLLNSLNELAISESEKVTELFVGQTDKIAMGLKEIEKVVQT